MKRLTTSFFLLLFVCSISACIFIGCKDCGTCDTCADCTTDAAAKLYWNKKIAQNETHAFALMLGANLKDITDEATKIMIVRKAIDSVRFYDDKTGYFYVYNYDCVNIAHATQKDLQDQNLYNHQDSKGNYVVRNLSTLAQQGGGFIEFYWIKPGADPSTEKHKLGYVEPIPNTNYFIGTGVYLE